MDLQEQLRKSSPFRATPEDAIQRTKTKGCTTGGDYEDEDYFAYEVIRRGQKRTPCWTRT